jgi:uroporphyrinogen-III synthase
VRKSDYFDKAITSSSERAKNYLQILEYTFTYIAIYFFVSQHIFAVGQLSVRTAAEEGVEPKWAAMDKGRGQNVRNFVDVING